MPVSTVFPPIYPNNLRIDLGQWNGTTVTFVDVSPWVDRASLSLEWHLDAYASQGRFTITVPQNLDTYHIDVWNEVRIYDPNGAYGSAGNGLRQDRYFRGFIIRLESESHDGVKIYRITLVDGNILFDKMTKPFVLPAATYVGTDVQIIHAMSCYCLPELYPSGIYAAPANPTVAPTISASGTGSALAAGQYVVMYTWTNMGGETMPSPKSSITLTAGQFLLMNPPSFPTNVSGVRYYVQGSNNVVNFFSYQGFAGTAGVFSLSTYILGVPPPLANSTTPYPINPSFDQPIGINYYSNLTVTIASATYREAMVELQKQIAIQIPGAEVPRFFMIWTTDPGDGTHAWRWQPVWVRDSDQPIDPITITDDTVETSSTGHYYGYTRVRDGSQMINDQWAVGLLADATPIAQHTASTVSYNAVGRYVSGKPIVAKDPVANTAAVLNLSRAELDKWKYVLETVTGVLTFVPYALRGFPRVSFRCRTEGGLDVDATAYPTITNPANLPVYVISRMELSWAGEGVLGYKLDLGTTFPELGEKGYGWRGGSITTRDVIPPIAPIWHNTDALDFTQFYHGQTHDITLTALWIANTEADLGWYIARYWIGAAVTPLYSGQIAPAGLPQITISAPVNTTVTFQIASYDVHGNTLGWVGAMRSVVTGGVDVPPAPIWNVAYTTGVSSTNFGYADLTWVDGTGGQGVAVTWNVFWQRASGGTLMTHFGLTTRAVTLNTLALGVNYNVFVQGVTAWGDVGTNSAWKTITVAAQAPGPPSTVTAVPAPTAVIGVRVGSVLVSWNAGSGGTGVAAGYDVIYYVTTAGQATGTIITVKSGLSYTITNVPTSVQYTYQVRSFTAWGDVGPWSTSAPTLTLAGQAPGPPASVTLVGSNIGPKGCDITVTWTAGTGGTGTPNTYDVRYYVTTAGVTTAIILPAAVNDLLIRVAHNLAVGINYTFQVRSVTPYGDAGPWSTAVNITVSAQSLTPPATVTAVAAPMVITSTKGGNVKVAWTAASGGTGVLGGYDIIYYQTSLGINQGIIVSNPTDLLFYTIVGIPYGVSYTYQVRAVTVYGDVGAWSTSAPTLTLAPQAPGAPATVTVTGLRTGTTKGKATVSWTAGTGGTGTADHYDVRYYVTTAGPTFATIIPAITSDVLSTVIPSLDVGTGYTFQVRSITATTDSGPWSVSAPTLTIGAESPNPPATVTATAAPSLLGVKAGNVNVAWSVATGGTGTVGTYDIVYYPTASGITAGTILSNPTDNLALTLVGIPVGVGYTYKVRAVTIFGEAGAWSPTGATLTLGAQAPGAPSSVTVVGVVTSILAGNVTVTWNAGSGGTGVADHYDILYYGTVAGQATGTILPSNPSDNLTYKIVGLTVGVNYTFKVRSVTAYGDVGPWSVSAPTLTLGADAPGAPATVSVVGARTGPLGGNATVTWTAGTGGTGTAVFYDVRYYVTASGSGTATIIPKIPSDRLVALITDLTVGTSYTFQVRSLTAYFDPGPWSVSAPTLTLVAESPGPPVTVTATAVPSLLSVKAGNVSVAWTAGTGGTGTISGYEIVYYVTTSGIATGTIIKNPTDNLVLTITGIPQSVGYTYKVRSVTPFGDVGAWSSPGAALTLGAQAPGPPTSVTVTGVVYSVRAGNVTVTWNAGSGGTGTATSYDILYYNTGSGQASGTILPSNPNDQLLYVITAIPVAVNYTYKVRSVTAFGDVGAWSTGTTFTLGAEAPGPPSSVTVTSVRSGPKTANATVSWNAGSGGTGAAFFYDVRYYVTAAGAGTAIILPKLPNDNLSVIIHGLVMGTNYTFNVRSLTTWLDPGAWSSSAPTLTPGADSPNAPATVTVSGTRTGPLTGQANLSWTAASGGTGVVASYEARYFVSASGAGTATIIPVALDNLLLIIPNIPINVQYSFHIRSITAFGDAGPWSSSAPTLLMGPQGPPAPTALTILNYNNGQSGQDAFILLGWTAGTGGVGTPVAYNIRIDWTDSSTGIVHKWHKNGIPVGDVNAMCSPLTAGPSYTITMWSVTAWGDLSSPVAITYAIPVPVLGALYNGGFELLDLSNKTHADGWTTSFVGTSGSYSISALGPFTGTVCARLVLVSPGSLSSFTFTSRPFSALSGRTYFATAWMKQITGTVGGLLPQFDIDIYNSAGVFLSSSVILQPGVSHLSSSWAEYPSMAFTMPASTGYVILHVSLQDPSTSGTITVDVDDIEWHEQIKTIGVADNAVDQSKIAALSVGTTEIIDATVTSAKLAAAAITTKTQFGTGIAPIQKGASNPGSPATDDRNYRTDVDRDLVYNGTLWYSTSIQTLSFECPFGLTALAASGTAIARLGISGDSDIWLSRWAIGIFVNTTNNATNYWSFQLRYVSSGNTITNLSSMTSAAIAVTNWTRIASNTFSPTTVPASNTSMFEIVATMVGTPGTVFLLPTINFRETL